MTRVLKKIGNALDTFRVVAWAGSHPPFFVLGIQPLPRRIERLNSDLKQAIGSKVPVRTKEKLRAAANVHMTMLENNPERVASCFQDPRVKYAA